MIRVENLSKRFDQTLAVDRLSFDAVQGEILGFLGPNGAGKTTTMRMLTCFLPATSGNITVDGMDVFRDSLKVRGMIGYLPESVPLYTDMRVEEYLRFEAGLHRVARADVAGRLNDVLAKCRLQDVRGRIIGQLSKGFRQRVGLAAALIHDPKVLILDEPTVGLDPNQIRETRALIKTLGRDRTIILSTHILPEVEAVCQRVIILDKGKLVAMDTPQNLLAKMQGGSEVLVEMRGPKDAVEAKLKALPGVLSVAGETQGDGVVFRVRVGPGEDRREAISQTVVQNGGVLRELTSVRARLEDIFAAITKEEKAVENRPDIAGA